MSGGSMQPGIPDVAWAAAAGVVLGIAALGLAVHALWRRWWR